MTLNEIGSLIFNRRQCLGLTQAQLAKLSGLSRATINQLETGTIHDLGFVKLMHLFDLLNLDFASHLKRQRNALQAISQTASVSYQFSLTPQVLTKALIDGQLPKEITAHIVTILDEAPLSMITAAIEEIAQKEQCSAKILWKHLQQWAIELHSPRMVWQ
jgi:transcriptional regulator with XRE-family HTH domain